jgi:CubicO group peptidase (beta-lactamase class C family)
MVSKPQIYIQKILQDAVDRGAERGIQCAVYHNGKLIVDAWAGLADPQTGRAVNSETLFPVFSVTKGIVATVIHLLAERKKIDYDDSICKYWPEFSAYGKENIKIRHILNHTAGMQNVPVEIDINTVCNWQIVCEAIAKSKPTWEPGTRAEYHAMTYGWILGEIAQRADGRTLKDLIMEEICQPLHIKDIYIGIPDEVENRIAILEDPVVAPINQNLTLAQSVPNWIWPLHSWMNRPDARRACVPGSNGIMNARAIAKHYAALLPGGVDGIELLPENRIAIATNPKIGTYNKLNPTSSFWTLGYSLSNGPSSASDSKISPFGHNGHGGSTGFADPNFKIAVGITKNLFSKENIVPQLINEIKNIIQK